MRMRGVTIAAAADLADLEIKSLGVEKAHISVVHQGGPRHVGLHG